MVKCVVSICKNDSRQQNKKRNGISYHRFPRNRERRCQWEQAVNREEHWSATPFSSVCSEHFDAKDFYETESGLRKLSSDAVPSINIHTYNKTVDRPNLYIEDISKKPCQRPKPTIAQQPIDDMSNDSVEVIKLKHKVRRWQNIATNRRRRLNQMWQQQRRLKDKVEQQKRMIRDLIRSKNDKSGKSDT